MAAVTLVTLTGRAREKADMVGSTFVTDAADSLWAFVNEGVQELHELLVESFGADYAVSTSALTTVAGTEAYALPSDFYKLLGVDLTIAGKSRDLKKYNFKKRNLYRNIVGTQIPRYRVDGAYLRLLPAPSAVYTGSILYAPTTPLLAATGSTVNFPNGWERYVVLHAAMCCLRKEESDHTGVEREKLGLRGHIIQVAANRDAGEPEQAVDVEAGDVEYLDYFGVI